MNIILEQINNKNDILTIDSIEKLDNYFDNTYAKLKCIKGFKIFVEENISKFDSCENWFFLDYSKYANLYLIFKTEQDILYYVEDNCMARGETIPKSYEKALNYLTNDDVIVYKIKSFKIDQDELKKYFDANLTKK